MKSGVLLTFILVLLARPCKAETTQGAMSIGLGYLTTFADANAIVQLSGGVDVPVSKSLNFWGDGAWDTNGEGVASQLTLGASHRFSPTNKGAFPFVVGGLDFSSLPKGWIWGAHVGAGATFWTSHHRGLRMEIHNVIWGGAFSFDEIVGRIGLTFR